MSNLIRKELSDQQAEFANFIMKNQVNYLTVEELNFRKAVFAQNQATVDSLNQDKNQTAYFEMNAFGDKT